MKKKKKKKIGKTIKRLAKLTSKSLNKAYEDYKSTQKVKVKKEIKVREDQIKKEIERIEFKDSVLHIFKVVEV